MVTKHKIINSSSNNLSEIANNSIALVVTSPPYPMIEMWDGIFASQSEKVKVSFEKNDFTSAFIEMHNVLNSIWDEVDRVTIDGGIVCINIGDATRSFNDQFQLFSNHTKIIQYFYDKGYMVLPDIIWRKTTNAPNKFMGSGMYPAGAYVTYEHEYILIFRKGGKRIFKTESDKMNRRKSAYFWEERNVWFSDLWDIRGTNQVMTIMNSRERSGAFPFELAYRLINMYSVKGDYVLDPFVGTGTTCFAAMASERNSYGVEIDPVLSSEIFKNPYPLKDQLNNYIQRRLQSHINFTIEQIAQGKDKFYRNEYHNFDVKTKQEIDVEINFLSDIEKIDGLLICNYQKNEGLI